MIILAETRERDTVNYSIFLPDCHNNRKETQAFPEIGRI